MHADKYVPEPKIFCSFSAPTASVFVQNPSRW